MQGGAGNSCLSRQPVSPGPNQLLPCKFPFTDESGASHEACTTHRHPAGLVWCGLEAGGWATCGPDCPVEPVTGGCVPADCYGLQGCPDGWTRLSTGCYRVVAGPSGAGLSKDEAGRECEARGGRLAGVESKEEREAVAAWYRGTQQPNCYQQASVLWLGIHNHTK